MATARIGAGNFSMSSVWKAKNADGTFVMDQEPTVEQKKVSFGYSLPSGAKIRMACIRATVSSPASGISILTVNGASLTRLQENMRNANVNLSANRGTLTATFVFKANGELADEYQHTSVINFTNVHLLIEYDPPVSILPIVSGNENGLTAPPQAACIYVQDSGNTYNFDGVLKVQHTASIKIEEETDEKSDAAKKKKYSYVNNARNEADKVQLEVVISDVYTGGGFDAAGAGSTFSQAGSYMAPRDSARSENAYTKLHDLKEARELVTVLTEEFVYTDMLIESINITRDENTPHGWTGTISFQHTPEGANADSGKDKTSSKPKTKKVVGGDASWFVNVADTVRKLVGR